MTAYPNHLTITKEGINVTFALTKVTNNWTKLITLFTVVKTDDQRDIEVGANTTQFIDLLNKPEKRFTIDANLATGIDGPTIPLSANATSGAATISVTSTASFPTTGTLTINGDTVTYTGKTSTTFTGCAGITTTHYAGNQVVSNFDTHSDATDKLDDMKKIFFGGGEFTMNLHGTDYTINSDKFESRWVSNDESTITVYDVKFTVVVGEDYG